MLLNDRAEARSHNDPCANLCTLANIDAAGLPQARTLVLREVDGQLSVFINATSPKWTSLCASVLSVVIWLPTVNVQYRLTCNTQEIPRQLVHDSWHLRPDVPKRLDWYYTRVSPQSSRIENRDKLLNTLDELALPNPLVAPETARGLFLLPTQVERLHLGQENGVHDRQQYTLTADVWERVTLVP